MVRLLVAILLLNVGIACVPPGQDVEYAVVLSSTRLSLALSVPEELVIRNEEEWCGFWARVHSDQVDPPACDDTVADFEEETILAVALGSAPNGCHAIYVDGIVTGSEVGAMTVFVREVEPGAGCLCTHSFTTPVEAVVVSNPVGSVEFVRESTTLACE